MSGGALIGALPVIIVNFTYCGPAHCELYNVYSPTSIWRVTFLVWLNYVGSTGKAVIYPTSLWWLCLIVTLHARILRSYWTHKPFTVRTTVIPNTLISFIDCVHSLHGLPATTV